MTSIFISLIIMAIVAVLVTRPGVADFIKRLSHFLAASIQATVGVDSE